MIVVFGSNVLDLFFHVADLPEKDTALHLESHEEAPGGKGANQAVAAKKAGADVRFYGAVGEGGHGRQMYKNLATYGVDVSGLVQLQGIPSGLATIFVDEKDGTHKVVVSHGANLKVQQSTVPDRLLTPDSTVLVQAELPLKETEALLVRAKKRGARTIMNLAPVKEVSETILKNLDVIILNEHEANGLGKNLGMQTADKEVFADELYRKYNLITVVTLGPEGAICGCNKGVIRAESLPIKAVDTIGAGDAFSGYLAASLDAGADLEEALRRASIAGSLACTKVGAQVAVPYADEVDKIMGYKVEQANTANAKLKMQ